MRVPLATASPLLAAVLWTGALLVDPGPLAPWSVLLVGIGLLTMATLAVIGMIIAGGRWALRLGVATVVDTLLIAVIRPTDPLWYVALVASITAGALLFQPAVTNRIRKLPSATGPPPRAVLVTLLLASTPGTIGLAAWDQPTAATVVVGLTAPLAALWYAKVLPGGLYGLRVIWPLLAIALAPLQPLPAALVSLLTASVVLALAWQREVGVAFHPPREIAHAYPIPPELVPREILDAADLDERGHPR